MVGGVEDRLVYRGIDRGGFFQNFVGWSIFNR
jgi:hypothetical protein